MKSPKLKIDPVSLFSHELKTPLSSLQLGLSLLEKDFENNKDLIPLLREELEYLSHFITDNLDLRTLQNKKELFDFKWQSFDLLLEKACSSLNLLAKQAEIRFDVQSNFHDGELFIDESWMFRALYNLLSNALNFSKPNSSIVVKFGLNKAKDFYCSVANQTEQSIDTKKVFDLFYTKNFKQKVKGTGLGLTLVKAIIKAHKGQIKVESKNQEVLFYFSLPKLRSLKSSA